MGEIIAVLAALFFATSHVLVKKGSSGQSQDNGTFLSLFLTLALALIFWILWRQVFPYPIDYTNPEGVLWFVLGGVFSTYLGRTWVYMSIQRIGSVRNSAIAKLNPFFTVFLAAFILGESFTASKTLGMLLVFSGVFIAARQSMLLAEKSRIQKNEEQLHNRSIGELIRKAVIMTVRSGIYYGPLSALAYALGNTFRKKGVLVIADPIFGTIVGALVGTVFFLVMAMFKPQYRKSVIVTFTRFHPALFFAGLLMSLGQIFYFVSLNFIEVSRATLIVTLDTAFAMIVSSWVFKTYENITPMTIVSALLTVIGAIVIILY